MTLDPNFDNVPPHQVLHRLAHEQGWFVVHRGDGGFDVCKPNDPGAQTDLNRAADSFWWEPETETATPITEEQRAARTAAAAN
ncbi:hypothetical protein MCEMSEM18_03530 [Comamonadaceae bacterium]